MLMADAIYVFIHNVTPTLVEDCSVCQICEVSWCTNPKKIKKLVQFLRGWDGPTTLRVEGECAFMLKIKNLYILFCMCVYFLKNKGLITVWKKELTLLSRYLSIFLNALNIISINFFFLNCD